MATNRPPSLSRDLKFQDLRSQSSNGAQGTARPTQDRAEQFNALYKAAVESGEPERFATAAAFAPEQWCDVASKLAKEGQDELAVEHFRLALQVTADARIRSGVFNNLGLLLAKRAQMSEAMELFEKSRELLPGCADSYSNIALVHKWAGNLDEADYWINRALALNPWHCEAQFIQALIALLRGDYLWGFELYECRWRSRANGLTKLETNKPEWDGSNGNNVFVYGEQGAGDIFLMLRYARLIKDAGLRQTWVVKRGMKPLIETMGCIDLAVEDGDPIPDFDCHIPAASLPRVFGTGIDTVPAAPYIPKLVQSLKPKAQSREPLRVGICWRGQRAQGNDVFRSTNLEQWAPVLEAGSREQGAGSQIEFHSLQVDGAEEALLYPEIQIDPALGGMTDKVPSWLETARRIASMDLVISVDTSIVHLAGAMGVPTWCALHCRPYFVYPLVREDCPWYPSVRLFKQKKEFEWEPVFNQIADELRATVGLVQ